MLQLLKKKKHSQNSVEQSWYELNEEVRVFRVRYLAVSLKFLQKLAVRFFTKQSLLYLQRLIVRFFFIVFWPQVVPLKQKYKEVA